MQSAHAVFIVALHHDLEALRHQIGHHLWPISDEVVHRVHVVLERLVIELCAHNR